MTLPSKRPARDPGSLDPAVLDALANVMDPEIGLSLVDLGLVYRAVVGGDAVEVALTLTTRACPLGEMILDEARDSLAQRFPGHSRIDVRLVWEPLWTPDFITPRGRDLLGRPSRTA
ncbi:metal-sulfur cluster assembly factor [Microvirga thermotolerans]|uniref:DUF59 domain-containing protein n=1 Tax=Microvirga thermotolerans TaxID=2651334 RepID=A0A5P9JRU5_9HYPH|nr:metal-sulfur cluster assembly factor [Microvirga thermotolerans]QFU14821.1 DUF59 domain-containing protein [Microvirga thermotolerans]